MTKLDLVLARLKQLSPDRQDYIATEIEFLLDHEGDDASRLTDAQWAEVESELASEDAEEIPHSQVVRELREKYGE